MILERKCASQLKEVESLKRILESYDAEVSFQSGLSGPQ